MTTRMIILLLAAWAFAGSSGADPCKDLLAEYVETMHAASRLESSDAGFALSLRVETIGNDPERSSEVRVRMRARGSRVAYESEFVSLLQGGTDVFTVVHPQRTIYRSSSTVPEAARTNTARAATLQDSLLRHATVTQCRDVRRGERPMKEIVMKPGRAVRQGEGIATVTYYYDLDREQLEWVVMTYRAGHELRRKTLHYEELEFSPEITVGGHVAERFLTSEGKLRAEFTGYELVDNR